MRTSPQQGQEFAICRKVPLSTVRQAEPASSPIEGGTLPRAPSESFRLQQGRVVDGRRPPQQGRVLGRPPAAAPAPAAADAAAAAAAGCQTAE